MSNSPRRISLEGGDEMSPSASGATIAGQKNLRNMKAPTAVNLASGNRFITAVEICELVNTEFPARFVPSTYNAAYFPEGDGNVCC